MHIPINKVRLCLQSTDLRCPTPLNSACKTNNIKVAEAEIIKGEPLTDTDSEGNTYLHVAVKHNSFDVVCLLLAQQKINVDAKNYEGESPIHLSRNLRITKRLIDSGCDLNIINNYTESPLITLISDYQCCADFIVTCALLQMLLEHGADPNTRDSSDNVAFCHILLQRHFSRTQIYELFCLYLLYGGDVNLKLDNRTISSFMHVVIDNSSDLINLMLPYVIDINEVDTFSRSILMIALANCNDVAFNLIKSGTDIDYCNDTDSCLALSLLYQNTDLFEYIWNNCDKSYVLYKDKLFLKKFLQLNWLTNSQFLQWLYTILDSEYAIDLVARAVPFRIYKDLIKAFTRLNIEKDERVKVIYTFLTRSNQIDHMDLLKVYTKYGYNEELEAFLVVNVEIINFVEFPNFITRLGCPGDRWIYDAMEPKPLVELSRNAVHRSLKPPSGMTWFRYYNEIQQLDLPQLVKDIICLKRNINAMNH